MFEVKCKKYVMEDLSNREAAGGAQTCIDIRSGYHIHSFTAQNRTPKRHKVYSETQKITHVLQMKKKNDFSNEIWPKTNIIFLIVNIKV